MAAMYLKHLIPGLFAYGFLHNLLRFLQTQSIVTPLVVCSLIPLVIHIGIAYVLVHWTSLGFKGATLAASISLWTSAFMLIVYVIYANKLQQTWKELSMESFKYVLINFKLALSSAAMVCLEYWAFEILVLMAGLMPNAEKTTSLIAMCVNTEAITYIFSYGVSAAASTRVSNELGAGNCDGAKRAMAVTLKLSLLLALTLCVVVGLGFGHDAWAGLFSDSPVISIIFDSFQGVLFG